MSFGKRLQAARRAMKYSQREVAQQLGVKHPTVGSWEREERRPRYEELARLGTMYGVSLDYLVYGKREVTPDDRLRQLGAMLRGSGATEQDVTTILNLLTTRRQALSLQRRISVRKE